jgi:hypothetical protein
MARVHLCSSGALSSEIMLLYTWHKIYSVRNYIKYEYRGRGSPANATAKQDDADAKGQTLDQTSTHTGSILSNIKFSLSIRLQRKSDLTEKHNALSKNQFRLPGLNRRPQPVKHVQALCRVRLGSGWVGKRHASSYDHSGIRLEDIAPAGDVDRPPSTVGIFSAALSQLS